MAALQSPSKPIYDNLRKAVKHDTSACTKIFDVRYLAEQGFYRYVYKIDSINLVRVDSILTYVGYPTREKVGHDYTDVVALIVHHQSDPSVRQAYLDRIRPYLSLERVELIENRTQEILRGN